MTALTGEDVPTLRRLAEFFADRTRTGGILRASVCKAVSGVCLNLVNAIERNGQVSSADMLDSVGRIKSERGKK